MEIIAPIPPAPLNLEQIKEKLSYLKDENVKNKVANLLHKYDSCASHGMDSGTSFCEMDFPVPETFAKNTKIYNLSLTDTQHLRHFVDLCMRYEILEYAPSTLQFGSPCFVVPRKNKQDSPRIVVDSRGVNASVPYNTSSITLDPISTLKNILPNVKYACFMDIKQAFYNLKLSQKVLDTGVSNIVTSFGTFRFRRAITGYSGTPSLLLHYILSNIHLTKDNIISIIELLVVFFDDLSLFCWKYEDMDTMLQKLDTFLERLSRLNLKLNLDKCRFCIDLTTETIELLGYKIGQGKISIPDKKVQTISKIEAPKCLKDLQSFIGNLTYFRQLLPMNIHASMNALFCQVKNFSWDLKAEQHFQLIKCALLNQSLENDSRENVDIQLLYTDASSNALGSVLLGVSLQEFIEDNLPEMSYLPHEKLENYFIHNNNIGMVHDSSNVIYLFYKITLYLRLERDVSFSQWYEIFSQHCILNSDLMDILCNNEWTPDYVPNKKDYQRLFIDTINNIRVGAENLLDNPSLNTFLFLSFSRYSKRPIRIFYLSSDQVKEVDICRTGPETIKSEINIWFHNDVYHYLALRSDILLEDKIYKKTTREINLPDRELYSFTEKALRTNDPRLRGKVKILGYFSKSVSEGLINSATIAYLEILSILESLQYFETDIKVKKTLVLTDSMACSRILANKKVQSRKSKLDVLSQKIIFWFGNQISFLSISTKEQLADFISRLVPQAKNMLDFQPQISPIYECDLFQIFEPKLIARDKTDFINNIYHETELDNQSVNVMTTRGLAPGLIKQLEEIEGKGKKRKIKVNKNRDTINQFTDPVIPGPSKLPNTEVKDEFLNSSETKSQNVLNQESKDNVLDIVSDIILDIISESVLRSDFSQIKDKNIDNDVIIDSSDLKNNMSRGSITPPLSVFEENENQEIKESAILVLPDPIFKNKSIMSQEDRASLVSSNKLGLNPYLGLMDQKLNKPYSKNDIKDLNDILIQNYQDKIKLNENNKDNNIPSSEAEKENSNLQISMTPDFGQALNNAKVFNRSTFIQLQILENLSNDTNPTTLKFKDGLIILPFILYSLIAALTHNNLVHCGHNKLLNQIRRMYYVKFKTKLSNICNAIVTNCITCIKSKNNHFKLERGTSLHRASFYRNYTVAFDILEFPKVLKKGQSVDGVAALAVYMDVATQYLTVYVLKSMTQIEIQHTFAQYLLTHGHVKYFWTDNASNIRSKKNVKFLEELGSKFLNSAPYRSASRGNIENRIKILQNVLRICNAFKSKIHILNGLAASIFTVNTTKLYNCALSPYNLHFLSLYSFSGNIECQNDLFESSFTYDQQSLEKRMVNSQNEFKDIYNQTKEYILKRQEKLIEKLNKHRHPHNFSVGDLVFVRLDNLKGAYFHKNKPLYNLYVWRVKQVKKLIVKVENLVTGENKMLSPQQLKKLQQDKLGLYELPKEVARYFRLLTVDDVKDFNNMTNEIQMVGKENLDVSMESESELSDLDSVLDSIDSMSDTVDE